MVAYFHARGWPWRGHKQALRRLERDDPSFLASLCECLGETDLERQVDAYASLVSQAARPLGAAWAEGDASAQLAEENGISADEALQFCEELFRPD